MFGSLNKIKQMKILFVTKLKLCQETESEAFRTLWFVRDIVAKIKNWEFLWTMRRGVIGRGVRVAFGMQKSGSENRKSVATEKEREKEKENCLNSGGGIEITVFARRQRGCVAAKIQRLNRVIIPKTINDDVATLPFCSPSADQTRAEPPTFFSVLFGRQR